MNTNEQVAHWAQMFSQAVDNGEELARELRLEIQKYQATLQEAALALRTEADDIGMNDPTTADFLNKWADRLWQDRESRDPGSWLTDEEPGSDGPAGGAA